MIIWLVIPAKEHSKWKTVGPFGRRKAEDVAPRAAAAAATTTTARRPAAGRPPPEPSASGTARRRASPSGVASVVPGAAQGRAAANVAPRGWSHATGR